ncbi:unnamed protein product [Moneuplotes crassus]|uniref:Uncharacterized protein n=1 Tax=Euplotes crassus TaxID=5936 RepID=A0AAD1UF43_EUPCR|nr:unnamed protein product [Moneuplotes crassus]
MEQKLRNRRGYSKVKLKPGPNKNLGIGGKNKSKSKNLRPSTARIRTINASGSAYKFYTIDQYKNINLMFSGSKIKPKTRNQSEQITPIRGKKAQIRATNTQVGPHGIENDIKPAILNSHQKPHHKICKFWSSSVDPNHIRAQQLNGNLTEIKPRRPVTATYRRIKNTGEGGIKHQLRFSFKFENENNESFSCTGSPIKGTEDDVPQTFQHEFPSQMLEDSEEVKNEVIPQNNNGVSQDLIAQKDIALVSPEENMQLNIGITDPQEVECKPHRTLKKLEDNDSKFMNYIPEEKITPTSMAYYKKIRRPQSAVAIPEQFKHKADVQIGSSGAKISKKIKPKNQTKKRQEKPRVKYDINTILSNRSQSMKIKEVFMGTSSKISDLISIHEKEKVTKLSSMTKEQYHDFLLGKLMELEAFLAPENHKRWYREKNPELTSSLMRSQINMIRNALGADIVK